MSLTPALVDRAMNALDAEEAEQIERRRVRFSHWAWTILDCRRPGCRGRVARLAAAHAEHRDARCPVCGAGNLERVAGPVSARIFRARPVLIF